MKVFPALPFNFSTLPAWRKDSIGREIPGLGRGETLDRAQNPGPAFCRIRGERFRLERRRGHPGLGKFRQPRAAMIDAAEDVNLLQHPIRHGGDRRLAITGVPRRSGGRGLALETDLAEEIVVLRYR